MTQLPGNLPEGVNDATMLTVAQFALWQQVPERTVRRRLTKIPGVQRVSQKSVSIHLKTYIERSKLCLSLKPSC
jgi:hypothetical protein